MDAEAIKATVIGALHALYEEEAAILEFDIGERTEELIELASRGGGKHSPIHALFDCRMIGLYPTTREPLRAILGDMVEAERREGCCHLLRP